MSFDLLKLWSYECLPGVVMWGRIASLLINSFLVFICFAHLPVGDPESPCSMWFSADYKLLDSLEN